MHQLATCLNLVCFVSWLFTSCLKKVLCYILIITFDQKIVSWRNIYSQLPTIWGTNCILRLECQGMQLRRFSRRVTMSHRDLQSAACNLTSNSINRAWFWAYYNQVKYICSRYDANTIYQTLWALRNLLFIYSFLLCLFYAHWVFQICSTFSVVHFPNPTYVAFCF